MSNPKQKITIIGGGIAGAVEALFALHQAKLQGNDLRITIYDKNDHLSDTTTFNIFPSLTPDEILSVVPRGSALVEKLGLLFSEPGGIRVDDVPNVNGTQVADKFISEVQRYSADEDGHAQRTEALLQLGRRSMEIWQQIYEFSDEELQQIMREANFNPCREPLGEARVLRDGYRIDLIYNVPNARQRAEGMQADYQKLGYQNCKILTPDEVAVMDPSLIEFSAANSEFDDNGTRVWKNTATAIFRPGGCIDTNVLLPKLYSYLKKHMGTYVNENGVVKDCFRLKFDREVDAVLINDKNPEVEALHFTDGSIKTNNTYETSNYVFCPGEAVGTLDRLGFVEPAYAGFAGPSLRLNIPVPADQLEAVSDFNHCMEVHQEGVVLAWQARCIGDKISIGVAGTKAFYSDQTPNIDHDFAKNRHLLQFNMINDVLPQFVSMALGRDTRGEKLTFDDLNLLIDKNIAKRWVGVRAVAYDGFPTLGNLYVASEDQNVKINNARTTTHLGSGGGSFAPAAVVFSNIIGSGEDVGDPLVHKVAQFSSSVRK